MWNKKSSSGFVFLVVMTSFLFSLFFSSCHYKEFDMSKWDMSDKTRDSLQFEKTHHYTLNYNFKVNADSLLLYKQFQEEGLNDTIYVVNGDHIVVADIQTMSKDSVDSVWIKVAKDQDTMGWIHEKDLLKGVVPTDPISQFIHMFSGTHIYWFLAIVIASVLFYVFRVARHQKIKILFYNDVESWYPTLLCLLMVCAAVLYGSIQLYVPDTWQEYYFHPTLNPFAVPFILSAFLTMLWLIIIVAIATADEIFRQENFITAVTYLSGLGVICVFSYLFFTLSTLKYVGYPCFVLFVFFLIYRFKKEHKTIYVCGNCGKRIGQKGECPYCGAMNE